ncbi:MAG: phosphomannomutase/phosphoglucomutase [Gammaproteobacteria bacterium]|nr:phosphomannomutase/phosphoglucomutase [Gammaproteobacteria bacterium]
MNIPAAIFRAYDIRGIVSDALTPEVVERIGQAFGSEAAAQGQQTVVIGRDGRLSSPILAKALAAGLQRAGRDVVDIGLVPTPVLYFATYFLNTGTGIMITGSHNPPDYNGLKMMIDGNTLFGDDIQKLRIRIENGDIIDGEGEFTEQDVVQDYIQHIVGDVKLGRPIKFAVDCGNGAAGDVAVKLFKAFGLEPIELFCDVDGTFPNHHPDPSKEENLVDLRNTIAENNLELGLAFDGDGDRIGVVDGDGNVIWPDRQMILYARDILKRNSGATIVFDVKCSKHLRSAIVEAGGKPVMSKTGHSFIKLTLKKTGALLGGEMSGHIFFKERWFGFDDALYSAIRLLEILSHVEQSPQEIFAALPNSVNTPELNIKFAEGEHYEFIEQFIAKAKFKDAEIVSIDGIRADFADGWGLVRASNTTPSLVMRFEADTHDALQRIQDQFREQMLKINPDLSLPF